MDLKIVRTMVPLYHIISQYHRHEIKHLENIPKEGPCLVLANHSLATYDLFLLAIKVYVDTGREPYGLADSNFYKFPAVAEIAKRLNMVEASHPNAEQLLSEGKIVYLAPGGMKEAIRGVEDRYKILWEERLGFAKLAIKTQSPIVLAACPEADDIYEVQKNILTDTIYKNFKLPFVFPKGLFSIPLPKPVKLTHYLSAPIIPPQTTPSAPDYEDLLLNFHREIIRQMEDLMLDSLN